MAPSNLTEALREQRTSSARRINPLRLFAVALVWLMALAFGWDVLLFTGYFAAAAVTFALAHRFTRAAELSVYAIALFDMPVIYALQRQSFAGSTSPGAVAGFTVAIFAVLVALSLLALDSRSTLVTVASGTVLAMLLQLEAGITPGGMLSTPVVLGLVGVTGHLVSKRLVEVTRRLLVDAEKRKELEVHLHHADRMAMMGLLSASVAHEVGGPLTYLFGNVELMRLKLERDEYDQQEFIEHLDEAAAGAERIAHIVRDMRQMARKEDVQSLKEIDVKGVVEGTVKMASAEIRKRAQLEVELGPVPGVVASETSLAQVMLNLLINAAQAIPEGNSSDQRVRVQTRTGKNGEAVISVSDTGSGIDDEAKKKLFTPFFTTKPKGQGTGLGLSICAQLVHRAGGNIAVDSEVGRGTTFTVMLPPRGGAPLKPSVTAQ
ncbi:MAG: GHKL domain-containing protein [Myxococcaceae bacterium]|nr:GHKL domain-containing protein [Myxococcaceae bacterium]